VTPEDKFGTEGLAFDDVLLIPARSDVPSAQVSTRSFLTRELALDIPILSAAMDTVTEARMAIALGRLGGMGVLHRNLSVEDQTAQAKECKAAGVRVGAAEVTAPAASTFVVAVPMPTPAPSLPLTTNDTLELNQPAHDPPLHVADIAGAVRSDVGLWLGLLALVKKPAPWAIFVWTV